MEIGGQNEQIMFQNIFPITEVEYIYMNAIGMILYNREIYIFRRFFILFMLLSMLPLAFIRTINIFVSLAIDIVIISLLAILLTKIQMKLDKMGKYSVLDSYYYACNITKNMIIQAKKKKKAIFYTYKILFYKDVLQIETLEEKLQANYSTIEHLIELEKYIFLYSYKREVHMIDKSNFSVEELTELKDFLELKCHKKIRNLCFFDISKIKERAKRRNLGIILILGMNILISIAILLWKYSIS